MHLIRSATDTDAPAIAEIYNHYVANSIVTFEEEPVPPAEIARRISAVQAAGLPWIVAEDGGKIAGYAYATQWKERIGYRFSVETTIYLAQGFFGQGIGTRLYAELFRLLEAGGTKSAIGGIALPNNASVALHEKMGMKKVAEFERVGVKFDQWINVGYWQRWF
ncbi:MAG TPA: arsinothricin resistance N-acetyltransferase ArsN1 family B [Gemmatimonadaceae bacterium]|nr:arsinothricin resistance N-acetyltransferase ArsN1 family B [Gemmatimonadaceae bacterium]